MKISKYFLTAIFAISFFTLPALAQMKQDVGAVKKNIDRFETSFCDNFAKGNAKEMSMGYTTDAVAFPPQVPAANGRKAIQKVFENIMSMGHVNLKLHTDKLDVMGNNAVTHGTYQLELTMKDGKVAKDNGKFLEVWQKQKDGNWLRKYDMWNSSVAPQLDAGKK